MTSPTATTTGRRRDRLRVLTDVTGEPFWTIVVEARVEKILRSLIFGVTPYDVTTIAAAVATLSAIATLACVLPALRASKADPTSILRTT